jgi:hypothetical protein
MSRELSRARRSQADARTVQGEHLILYTRMEQDLEEIRGSRFVQTTLSSGAAR